MKRIPWGYALVVLALSLVNGCLPGGSTSSSGGASSTIVVWHWMTDRQPAFEHLARKYEKETGVKVDFQLYAPSEAYAQKARAAAQGATLPDIFGILGEKRDFASFVKAGHILNLTPYMEADSNKWRVSLFEKALGVDIFPAGNTYGVEPGIYGVPLEMTAIKLVYNKTLLRQLGGDPDKPPATLADFLAIGQKLKATNLQGLVAGWSELWMIECFADSYAFNIMGKDKMMRTIKGEVPYTDPDWIAVFDVFRQLRQSGMVSNAIVTMINKTAEQLFASGKAVFAFNGSWGVNVYKSMNPDLSYGVMMPPRVSEANPMSFRGGAGSSFMVNARSSKREQAVQFLRWLSDTDQQEFLATATNNLPANKNALKDIPPVLTQFSADMEQATHPNTWDVTEYPLVLEAFGRGIQAIIIGELTPEQVAREVQTVKARERAKHTY